MITNPQDPRFRALEDELVRLRKQMADIRDAYRAFETAMGESGGDYAYAPDWEQIRPTTAKAIGALDKAINGDLLTIDQIIESLEDATNDNDHP